MPRNTGQECAWGGDDASPKVGDWPAGDGQVGAGGRGCLSRNSFTDQLAGNLVHGARSGLFPQGIHCRLVCLSFQ